MISKRSAIVALVGLNLLLAAMAILGSYSLPTAYAQTRGQGGDFLAVTAQPGGSSADVLYLMDLENRKLHAFYLNLQNRQLTWANYRDMVEDFRKP